MHAAPDRDLDLLYLQKHQARDAAWDIEEALKLLEDEYLATEPEKIADILDGAAAGWPKHIFQEAARFRQDFILFTWIRDQNINQGVAPSPKLVTLWRRVGTTTASDPHGEDADMVALTFGEKKWLQRFRRRWAITLGKVPVGDVIPLPSLRQKALS